MKKSLVLKILYLFLILIVVAGASVFATTTYFASKVTYKDGKSVEDALNDLYIKSNKIPQQVATLTTKGAEYTFQNDGYVIGTATNQGGASALVYIDDEQYRTSDGGSNDGKGDGEVKVSFFVKKGSTFKTRSEYGIYNLVCYEFK